MQIHLAAGTNDIIDVALPNGMKRERHVLRTVANALLKRNRGKLSYSSPQ